MNGIGNHLGRIIIPNLLIGKWTDFYQGRSYIGAKNKYSNPKNVDKTKGSCRYFHIKKTY